MNSANFNHIHLISPHPVLLSYIVILIFFITACQPELEIEIPTPNCTTDGGVLQLDCPAAPNTNITAQPEFDYFAWNTFIAMNWPALEPTATTPHPRGIPDLKKSFLTAASDDLLVWETLKEKREIFNVNQETTTSLPPWNALPDYGLVHGISGDILSTFPGQTLGDTLPPSGIIWNTLDETEEVNGEELENSNPKALGKVVNPRVWKGDPSEGNPVVYQVKVNYDFYKYVDEQNLYIQDTAIVKANSSTPIQLPFRSTNSSPSGQNPNRVTPYSVDSALVAIQAAQTNSSALPPEIGAVHIKTAWIRLSNNDDHSKYHTTRAEYYVTDTTTAAKNPVKRYATFGLVGLHIIQRVHTPPVEVVLGDTSEMKSRGGTFIFASWEHVTVTSGYTYSNYVQANQGLGNNSGWVPHKAQPIQVFAGIGTPDTLFLNPAGLEVKRRFPILPNTVTVNDTVHARIKRVNPNSVWLNYRLIGTQFQSVESLPDNSTLANLNDPLGIGQPQYMSNLVIETSQGLQYFQGQPPATVPIKHFLKQGIDSNANQVAFARNNKNMAFAGHGFNMGGCMGCHGIAQSEGYSFSFVLLAGHEGAGVDTQEKFDFTPPKVDTTLSSVSASFRPTRIK